jgi:protein involved in polysaccharide export with SLBB domain
MAGGLTDEAWEEQVSLSRRTAEGVDVRTIDFTALMSNRFLADNLPLQSGDVIIVPRATRGVIVLGEVQRPGYYQFREGDQVLDAIMLAGGFLESADEAGVSLTRQTADGSLVEMIDFSLLKEDRVVAEGDRPLEDGDVIIVPKATRGVIVLGEVQRPGYYQFKAGDSVLDAIMLAGGFLDSADEARVSVTKRAPEDVRSCSSMIDFSQLREERYVESDASWKMAM